ncbi:hypothetical protein PM082_010204 [Marasmius tenuissimus]|nr:hypothetical protein PM082_010204 [Marasmius tenuissimus]
MEVSSRATRHSRRATLVVVLIAPVKSDILPLFLRLSGFTRFGALETVFSNFHGLKYLFRGPRPTHLTAFTSFLPSGSRLSVSDDGTTMLRMLPDDRNPLQVMHCIIPLVMCKSSPHWEELGAVV